MNVITDKIKNSFLDSVAAESVLRFVSSAFKSAIFLFLSPIASYTNTIIQRERSRKINWDEG